MFTFMNIDAYLYNFMDITRVIRALTLILKRDTVAP
jgi:hypothetical protein